MYSIPLDEKKLLENAREVKNILIGILPTELREEFFKKSFIAGGCFYSWANFEEPKDYDFFLTDKDFANRFYSYFEKNGRLKYRKGVKVGEYNGIPLILTDNAVSLGRFQVIMKWVGEPDDVVSQFDFKHLQFYFHLDKLVVVSDFKYLATKKLYYNEDRARDIVGTIFRTSKFAKRGMEISNSEMSKILLKLNEVGFSKEELETLRNPVGRNNFGSGD